MFDALVTAGAIVGAVIGAAHAFGVYTARIEAGSRHGSGVRARLAAGYSALWTLALWTVFGPYVLFLWTLSLPFWLGRQAAKVG